VIEMSGSPPAAFTPGRTVGAKGGPGRRQGIAVQNTSVTLDAVVSSSVATQITASQTPQRVVSLMDAAATNQKHARARARYR
jgi:hypothetical protein